MRDVLYVLILIVSLGSQGFARDAAPCGVGKRGPDKGFWTWAIGSRLKVYVRENDFRSDQISHLVKPLREWEAVSKITGAGVTLSYEGTTSKILECSNCVTIMRHSVFNQKTRHGGELKAFGVEATQIIKYAAILIDPGVTDPETLSNVVAHELGHTFGLLDCYNCPAGSTVMNRMKGMNVSNGMVGPTSCDVAAVKRAYEKLHARADGDSKVVALPDDKGEEPIEDDTPVVVPEDISEKVQKPLDK